MMNDLHLSQQQIAKLMQTASKKLGMSEEELKRQIQKAAADPKSVKLPEQAQQVLKDPGKMQQLLQSQQAQALLAELMKK